MCDLDCIKQLRRLNDYKVYMSFHFQLSHQVNGREETEFEREKLLLAALPREKFHRVFIFTLTSINATRSV